MAMGREPLLGIFWFVADAGGTARLLARTCALVAAEEYGDCLTFAPGHHETWEGWRRGTLPVPAPGLAPLFAATEYEEWPRGRVVLDRRAGRFVLYADPWVRARSVAVDEVLAAFRLPRHRTDVRADLHYRSTRLPTRARRDTGRE
jgi:hypothetical protein